MGTGSFSHLRLVVVMMGGHKKEKLSLKKWMEGGRVGGVFGSGMNTLAEASYLIPAKGKLLALKEEVVCPGRSSI